MWSRVKSATAAAGNYQLRPTCWQRFPRRRDRSASSSAPPDGLVPAPAGSPAAALSPVRHQRCDSHCRVLLCTTFLSKISLNNVLWQTKWNKSWQKCKNAIWLNCIFIFLFYGTKCTQMSFKWGWLEYQEYPLISFSIIPIIIILFISFLFINLSIFFHAFFLPLYWYFFTYHVFL